MLLPPLLAFLLLSGFSCHYLIYLDEGVAADLVRHLQHSLKQADRDSRTIDAATLTSTRWEGTTEMLIIPGGKERAYVDKMPKSLIDRIQRYVEGGGRLLGICGGAYFASAKVAFQVGTPLEVLEQRDLSLYPGTAYGSAMSPFSYSYNPDSMRAANVLMSKWQPARYASFYFMGGAYFDAQEVRSHGWQVLGSYAHSKRPAIIEGRVGRGRVVLTGPHIEVDHRMMAGLERSPMYKEMSQRPNRRQNAFKYILLRLERK